MKSETYTQNFINYELARQHAKTLAKKYGFSVKVNKHLSGFNVHVPIRMREASNQLISEMFNSMKTFPVFAGTFGAGVLILLKGGSYHEINPLVLKAFQRSDSSLTNASPEQIAEYLSNYNPEQLTGIINNVKGIFHEVAFVAAENTDGDFTTAVLERTTNHQGSDVILTDTNTRVVSEIQLKATDNPSYAASHLENYPETELYVTSEIADKVQFAHSSGFSNKELTEEVTNTISDLTDVLDFIDIGSVGLTGSLIAGTIAGVKAYSETNDSSVALQKAAESSVKTFATSAIFGLIASIFC